MQDGAAVAEPAPVKAQAKPGPTTSPSIVTKEMVQAAVDKVASETNTLAKRKPAPRGAIADVKRPRKPYTQTRERVSWTPKEHQRFLRALELYSRDWKRIEEYVGSKDVVQIRSHAQKHFLKLMKSGHGDRMPPPRHKKSHHADGERAVNYVPGVSQAMRLRAASGTGWLATRSAETRSGRAAAGATTGARTPQISVPSTVFSQICSK